MKKHMKRLPAPKTWRVARKAEKYTTRPKPGAHEQEMGMPLSTMMIKMGIADTKKEVKHILQNKTIQVDGKDRHSVRYPVGFMDVITLPSLGKSYRMIIDNKGLNAIEIKDSEAKTKLVKVTGKTHVKGGKVQIHTMDGRNLLLDKDDYKVGDSLLIEIPSQKVKDHVALEKGNAILLYKGQHAGDLGKVKETKSDKIIFTSGDEEFETRKDYALVIGEKKPVVKIRVEE